VKLVFKWAERDFINGTACSRDESEQLRHDTHEAKGLTGDRLEGCDGFYICI
jgi:hypothetical protein